MNTKTVLLAALIFSIFLIGCTSSSPSGNYAAYNQPQGAPPQQQQYVGGGCGVAPQTPYGMPVEISAKPEL